MESEAKRKKSRGFLLCFFSGLYPPPGTLPIKHLLIQRGLGVIAPASCDRRRRVDAHYSVSERAEITHAALVRLEGRSDDVIGRDRSAAGRAGHTERVTALALAT